MHLSQFCAIVGKDDQLGDNFSMIYSRCPRRHYFYAQIDFIQLEHYSHQSCHEDQNYTFAQAACVVEMSFFRVDTLNLALRPGTRS
jgi:hypothetical protein